MTTKKNKKYQRSLGNIIYENRISQHLSQQELAEKAGLSRYYIGSIENGARNCTMAVLLDIAKALNAKSWRMVKKAEAETVAD